MFGEMALTEVAGFCSSQELKFLEAKGAYARGKPIMSDEEFDDMKRQLKLRDSRICAQVGRMSLAKLDLCEPHNVPVRAVCGVRMVQGRIGIRGKERELEGWGIGGK